MALRSNDTLSFFSSIPWCRTLLTSPQSTLLIPPSRTPKPHSNEDSLFAETLQTPRAIRAALALHPRTTSPNSPLSDLDFLLYVGDGLDGWPQVLHGGIIATILDEVMGTLLVLNTRRVSRGDEQVAGAHVGLLAGAAAGEEPAAVGAHTAQLNIKYLAPVKTPGVVLVRCRIVEREGRKIWMRAVVRQREGKDGEKEVECAVGEALFIATKGAKL